MSDLKTSDVEKDSSLNIPGILADFFLKKISMPSDSDISDYKHKSKRKKSKHKKRKHKKSRHHHGNSNSDSSSRTSELNPKEVDDDLSSSEEMGIKRLKKIKNLKMHLATSTVLQPSVSSTTDSTVSDKNIVSSTTSENPVFYGPSLELLLSGVNSTNQNSDYVVPVKAPNKEKSSQVVENVENDAIVKSDLKIEHKLSSTGSVASAQINIDSINNTEVNYAMETDVNKFSNVSSSEQESSNTKTKEIDSENKVKKSASVNDTTQNNDNSDDIKKTDISSIDRCKKDSANLNKKTQQDVDSKIKSNNLNVVKSKIKSKRKHSRSRSRSSSHSKHASPKSKSKSRRSRSRSSSHSKHASPKSKSKSRRSRSRSSSHSKHASSKSKSKNRRSRSRSKDSYKSGRKRKIHSRSRSPHNKRNRSVERRRRRSYSRSQSRSHSRSRYRQQKRYSRSPVERYRKRTRSRSRSYGRYRRSRSRGRRYGRSRERHHTSRSRHGSKSRRSYSRSRSRSKSRQKSLPNEKSRSRSKSKEKHDTSKKSTKIDQAKVLETAKKNVLKMMKDGTLPEGLSVESLKKEQVVTLQTGGKSVQELTDFCVRLSQKENEPDTNDNDENDDKADDETGFVHHPFKVKEPTMIKLNIKNAVQLPIKTPAQKASETVRLSSVFPVSSGNKHKQKELEWVPVVPEDSKANTKSTEKTVTKKQETTTTVVAVVPPVENVPLPPPPAPPAAIAYPCLPPAEAVKVETPTFVPPVEAPVAVPAVVHPAVSFMPAAVQPVAFEQVPMITYTAPSEQPVCYPETPAPSTSVSVFKTPKRLDIPAIITKRFHALTKLQSNPNDFEAIRTLQEAQQSIQEWVESQQVPGLFTGSTDAKVLSVAELCGPTKYYYRNQKDILNHAPPVTEGKGMSLLKKMGWNPGEGLGKNKEGSLEPLVLDIKTDKKGLVSEGENSKKGVSSFIKELQGKHPVSALMELCSKRKWKPPLYSCVMEHGPPHKKVFCFKVEVNGVEYQPVNPCTNKKIAKADAAVLCLQSLNVLPKTT